VKRRRKKASAAVCARIVSLYGLYEAACALVVGDWWSLYCKLGGCFFFFLVVPYLTLQALLLALNQAALQAVSPKSRAQEPSDFVLVRQA
jgi:hypothetical protein